MKKKISSQTLEYPHHHPYAPRVFFGMISKTIMSSSTTTSPVQEISKAEHSAAQKVESAKNLATEEIESFRKDEDKRIEDKKASVKKEATDDLKRERESLGIILKDGDAETRKQIYAFKDECEKNTPNIIEDLVDQCISITP